MKKLLLGIAAVLSLGVIGGVAHAAFTNPGGGGGSGSGGGVIGDSITTTSTTSGATTTISVISGAFAPSSTVSSQWVSTTTFGNSVYTPNCVVVNGSASNVLCSSGRGLVVNGILQTINADINSQGGNLNLSGGDVNLSGSGRVNSALSISSGPITITGGALTQSGGTNSLTASTFNGLVSATNIEGVFYADQYSGSDIGAKINTAYATLPASGGTIVIPAGTYNYSTPIIFATQHKPVILEGQGGGSFYAAGATTLVYTSSTGIGITYNAEGASSGGSGLYNLSLVGPAGIYAGGNTGIGSSTTILNTTSTQGVHLGGTFGATGVVLQGVEISGWGKGVQWDSNTFLTDINNSAIQKNGMDLYFPSSTNAYENDHVTNSLIGDGNYGSGSIASNCVYIGNTSQSGDWQFTGNSFDDCQVTWGASAQGASIHLTNNHFENPNNASTSEYSFVSSTAAQLRYLSIVSVGNYYVTNGDRTSGQPIITNGGAFTSVGDTINNYNTDTSDVTKFVLNQDTNDTVTWSGLRYTGLPGTTDFVYATIPLGPQGYAVGNNSPQFYIASSTNPAILIGDSSSSVNGLEVKGADASSTLTPPEIRLNNNNDSAGDQTFISSYDGNSGTPFRGGILFTANNVGQDSISFLSGNSATVAGLSTPMYINPSSAGGYVTFGATTSISRVGVVGGFTLQSASSTFTTGAIGGGSLTAGTCASTTTALDPSIVTSTAAFITTPKTDPGPDFYWETVLVASSSVSTRVCAAGITGTPNSSAFNVKIIQ